MRIFISYTTQDREITIYKLKEIADVLKQIGEIYIDIIDNDSLNKQERVFYELDNSNLVILILSNRILNSDWVKKEIERALEKNIPIIRLTTEDIFSTPIDLLKYKIYSVISDV